MLLRIHNKYFRDHKTKFFMRYFYVVEQLLVAVSGFAVLAHFHIFPKEKRYGKVRQNLMISYNVK